MAKHMVMAGLKCPPLVGAQVIMANAMPMAKAQPIWNRDPNAVTPKGFSKLRVKLAMEAMPGKLFKTMVNICGLCEKAGSKRHLHVEEHACGFCHTFPQPSRSVMYSASILFHGWLVHKPSMLEIKPPLSDRSTLDNMSCIVSLNGFCGANLHWYQQ